MLLANLCYKILKFCFKWHGIEDKVMGNVPFMLGIQATNCVLLIKV